MMLENPVLAMFKPHSIGFDLPHRAKSFVENTVKHIMHRRCNPFYIITYINVKDCTYGANCFL
jgi:hypothetical protein